MPDDRITIRALTEADAASLIECFGRCYAGTYPADAFHDPARVAALVAARRLRSVVAVPEGGAVVGHMGLTLRTPDARTAEAGNTVVDPAYRGHHLAARLAAALTRLALDAGLVGFHHYPTTAHPVMQKLALAGGGVEVGVLLDYIPAGTRYVGFEHASAARVAVVAVYEPLAAAPARRVWVPARHRQLAARLYAEAHLDRELAARGTALPPAATQLTARFEERRALLRLEVAAPGRDLAARVAGERARHPAAPALVDLPLGDPAAEAAAYALAADGFFFGALLPEYVAAGDVLRLQRPAARGPAPALATHGGAALLSHAEDDRRAGAALAVTT